MVMREVVVVLPDGADDVALHDLHVVDVVEEFEVVRAHAIAEFDAPGGVIGHVPGVVDFGVEKLEAENYVGFFSQRKKRFDALLKVFHPRFRVNAICIACEADKLREPRFRHLWND